MSYKCNNTVKQGKHIDFKGKLCYNVKHIRKYSEIQKMYF